MWQCIHAAIVEANKTCFKLSLKHMPLLKKKTKKKNPTLCRHNDSAETCLQEEKQEHSNMQYTALLSLCSATFAGRQVPLHFLSIIVFSIFFAFYFFFMLWSDKNGIGFRRFVWNSGLFIFFSLFIVSSLWFCIYSRDDISDSICAFVQWGVVFWILKDILVIQISFFWF